MYCNPHTGGDDRTSICSPVSYECRRLQREQPSPLCRQRSPTAAEHGTAAEAERQVLDSAAANAGIFAGGTGPYSPHRGKAPAVSASVVSPRGTGGNSFCCAFNPVPTRCKCGMSHRHTVLRTVLQRTPSCPLLFEVIACVSLRPKPPSQRGPFDAMPMRKILPQETRFS